MIVKIRNPKSEARNESSFGFRASCFVLPAKRGFTLIETLVAITILTLAISGSLFSANSAIVATNIARDQLIASHLAQEGIEYARLMRDNEYLAAYHIGGASVSPTAWANFLSAIAQCNTPKICTLGLMQTGGSLALTSCPSGDACTAPFSLLSNGTSFTRTVQSAYVSENEERIVSTVSWSFHTVPYSVRIIDHFTPWQ